MTMNNFEFASYMEMKGYNVHHEEGFDVEALLLHEDVNYKPINYDNLVKAAKEEGYVLTDSGWIESNIGIIKR